MAKLTRVSDAQITMKLNSYGSVLRDLEDKLIEIVSVADFGAKGDGVTDNRTAFMNALSFLRRKKGGTLFVPAGVYFFGSYSTSEVVMDITDVSNVTIIAYGAEFVVETTAVATPFLFHLTRCSNWKIVGASFFDKGFNPESWLQHSRWGMGAVAVAPDDEYHSGLVLEDCKARNLTYFLVSDQATVSRPHSQRRSFGDIFVRNCYVENAYYGVDLIYSGGVTHVDMKCKDVRRGFISYGQRDSEVNIDLYTSRGFLGSNAFVSLACEGEDTLDLYGNRLGDDANVSNLKIRVTVSGYEAHTAYVHGYHQQGDCPGVIANVDAVVQLNNLSREGKNEFIGNTNVFALRHEYQGTTLQSTQRRFHNFKMDVQIRGSISGKTIAFESANTTDKHLLWASDTLLHYTSDIDKAKWMLLAKWVNPIKAELTGFTTPITTIGTSNAGAVASPSLYGFVEKHGTTVRIHGGIKYQSHSGTGQMRLNNLPLPIDLTKGNHYLSCLVVEGTWPQGQIVGTLGGAGDSQALLTVAGASSWQQYQVSQGKTHITFDGTYTTKW